MRHLHRLQRVHEFFSDLDNVDFRLDLVIEVRESPHSMILLADKLVV